MWAAERFTGDGLMGVGEASLLASETLARIKVRVRPFLCAVSDVAVPAAGY